MDIIVILEPVSIVMATSSMAGAFIGMQFDRPYAGGLAGLFLGPWGILGTLCAAGARRIAPGHRRSENLSFVLGPLGLGYAWLNSPPAKSGH